jgi:Fe-S-cluster containining protein
MSDSRDYRIELRIGREPVRLSARVPEAPLPLADLLPTVRAFADLVGQVAAREAQSLGRPVRCGPRCGACCRQPVPISPAEALDLRELVAGLPAEERALVLKRFAQAVERLRAAGLIEALRGQLEGPGRGAGDRRALGLKYFALGLPCPFLADESCSIHPRRPLACREYLVSSDPSHCADPGAGQVAVLDLPRRLSVALSRLGRELAPGTPAWLPLCLALADEGCDWAGLATAARPGPELFERLLSLLAGEVPDQVPDQVPDAGPDAGLAAG